MQRIRFLVYVHSAALFNELSTKFLSNAVLTTEDWERDMTRFDEFIEIVTVQRRGQPKLLDDAMVTLIISMLFRL